MFCQKLQEKKYNFDLNFTICVFHIFFGIQKIIIKMKSNKKKRKEKIKLTKDMISSKRKRNGKILK